MDEYGHCSIEELARLSKMGDTRAFAKLYEMFYQDLYRFALCTMKHPQDAEDAVSEAVINAYSSIHKLKKAESFKSWIFQILVNVCRKKWSSREYGEAPILEEASEDKDYALAQDVRNAFAVLTEEERMIVSLSVFGGYKSPEIGEILRLNANTVRSKQSRALEKMSLILK